MTRIGKSMKFGALGALSAAAVIVGSGLVKDVEFARAREQVESTREQLASVNDLATVFRNVGKVMEPSVVNIVVHKGAGTTGPRQLPPGFERMFPDRDGDGEPDLPEGFGGGGEEARVGTGSGVVMEVQGGSGFILTNNHVAGGATEMSITLADGRVIKNGKVVGTDPKTDLAVVKVEADRLIPAKWGDSDQLERGDWVMAFGSPFGYVGSMTHGIVSALNRQAGILSAQQGYESFIQVDAPINPGNSGGPLTNVKGEVVGINTAIASRSGGFQGIGFAIPSNQAKIVYASLKDRGRVVRGWLGVGIKDVAASASEVENYGFKGDKGVLVRETFEDTPAYGKLQPGDVVTSLNGKEVDDVQQLRNAIAATAPNTDVKLKVFREGKSRDVTLKVGEQPEDMLAVSNRTSKPTPTGNAQEKSAQTLGLRLRDVSQELAQRFGFQEDVEGAVVTAVNPRSPAAEAGFQVGDVVTRVGTTPVKSSAEALKAIEKQDASKGISFHVKTAGSSRLVFVEPQQQEK